MSHHYLPWIVGFTFSVIVGHVAIKAAAKQMWVAVDLDPDKPPLRPSPWQPAAIGLTERALFTAAILTGNGGFVAVWLGIKTVGQFKTWGVDQKGTTTGRPVLGRVVYNNFLLGQALSIGFAAAGAYSAILLRAGKLTPALLVVLSTLLGTTILAVWIRHSGRVSLSRDKG
jgi:hypothetical protein